MKKVQVKITAALNPVKDPLAIHLSMIYDFIEVTGAHVGSEGMEDAETYRGRYKKNMGQIKFNSILDFINKSGKVSSKFKPWKLEPEGLVTTGVFSGTQYLLELQANYIMIYAILK